LESIQCSTINSSRFYQYFKYNYSISFLHNLSYFVFVDDPWLSEPTGRSSATNDPWLNNASSSNAQANPWSSNHHTTANNGTGLSVNISDPWGVGANDSRTTITTSPPQSTNNPKSIDNELSEFFGASACKRFQSFSIYTLLIPCSYCRTL
jgi:hypothetical protein